MGRKKIKIEPIQEGRNRQVTYLKRKAGLFKKAHELATLTDSSVAVIVFGHNGRLSQFCSGDIDQVLLRYSEFEGNVENKGPRDFAGGRGEDDDEDDEDDKPNDHKSRGGPSGSRRPGGGGGGAGGSSGGGPGGNNGNDGSSSSPGEGGPSNYKSHGSDGGPQGGHGPAGEGSSTWQPGTGGTRQRNQAMSSRRIKNEAIDSNQSDEDSVAASRPSSPDQLRIQESSLKAAVLSKNHRYSRSAAKSRARNVKTRPGPAQQQQQQAMPISNGSLGLTLASNGMPPQRPLTAFNDSDVFRKNVLARPSTAGVLSNNDSVGFFNDRMMDAHRVAVLNAGRPSTAVERDHSQGFGGSLPSSDAHVQPNGTIFPRHSVPPGAPWMQSTQSAGPLIPHHSDTRNCLSRPPGELDYNLPHLMRANTAGPALNRSHSLGAGSLKDHHADQMAMLHNQVGNNLSSQADGVSLQLDPSSSHLASHDLQQQQMQAPFPPVVQQQTSQDMTAMQAGVHHAAFAPAMSANGSNAMYATSHSSSSRCGSVSSASLSMSRPGTDDYNSGAPSSACDTPLMDPVAGGPLSTIMPLGHSSSSENLGVPLQPGIKQEHTERSGAAPMNDWLAKTLTMPMGISAGVNTESALEPSSTTGTFADQPPSFSPENEKMVSLGQAMAPATSGTLQELVPGLTKSMNAANHSHHPEEALTSSTTASPLAADGLML